MKKSILALEPMWWKQKELEMGYCTLNLNKNNLAQILFKATQKPNTLKQLDGWVSL